MKKLMAVSLVLGIMLATVGMVMAGKVKNGGTAGQCTTIQDGTLYGSDGDLLILGYNQWGYNYQAHMFNGMWCDYHPYYRPGGAGHDWCVENMADVELMMKWNDAWLSNTDCDGWDVSGDWLLDFAGGDNNREFRNLVQDTEGNVIGEFWYLSGTWLYGGTLVGTITGDELYLHYERPSPLTYTGDFYGVIGENVITDGTFTDSNENDLTWTATGVAVKTLNRHFGFDSYIGSGAWLTNHERGSYLTNWDITGDWVLEFDYFSKLYIHDMVIVDNTFTGTGEAQFSSQTWTVAGTIDGDEIEMRIDYYGSSYYVDVVGTIAQDGTMSGNWENPSQSGTWESSSGVATGETCEYNYFCKIVAAPSDAYVENDYWYTNDGTEIGPVIWGSFAIIQEKTNDPCGELGREDYKSPGPVGLGFYT